MGNRILIVDDSEMCVKLAELAMAKLGEVKSVSSLKVAREAIAKETWSLIILDVNLTDGVGFDLLGDIKGQNLLAGIPVIFVTAEHDISKKSLAFSLGAEDYLGKPYNFLELQMRAQRLLKPVVEVEFLQAGSVRISQRQHYFEFTNSKDAGKVFLSPKEYLLLRYLMTNKNQIFSRQQLLDVVWGTEMFITDRTVDSHIYSIRKKLGACQGSLMSVRGIGYQFSDEVKDSMAAA